MLDSSILYPQTNLPLKCSKGEFKPNNIYLYFVIMKASVKKSCKIYSYKNEYCTSAMVFLKALLHWKSRST